MLAHLVMMVILVMAAVVGLSCAAWHFFRHSRAQNRQGLVTNGSVLGGFTLSCFKSCFVALIKMFLLVRLPLSLILIKHVHYMIQIRVTIVIRILQFIT